VEQPAGTVVLTIQCTFSTATSDGPAPRVFAEPRGARVPWLVPRKS
jgi:hypothetical protein